MVSIESRQLEQYVGQSRPNHWNISHLCVQGVEGNRVCEADTAEEKAPHAMYFPAPHFKSTRLKMTMMALTAIRRNKSR